MLHRGALSGTVLGWNGMRWAGNLWAMLIAPTMQKSQPTHKGVARITTYVHLCLKSQYTATFVQKKFRTYAHVWSRKAATYSHFFSLAKIKIYVHFGQEKK